MVVGGSREDGGRGGIATAAGDRGVMRRRGSGRGVRGGRDSGRVGGMVERVGEDDFSDDSMVVGDGGRMDIGRGGRAAMLGGRGRGMGRG